MAAIPEILWEPLRLLQQARGYERCGYVPDGRTRRRDFGPQRGVREVTQYLTGKPFSAPVSTGKMTSDKTETHRPQHQNGADAIAEKRIGDAIDETLHFVFSFLAFFFLRPVFGSTPTRMKYSSAVNLPDEEGSVNVPFRYCIFHAPK